MKGCIDSLKPMKNGKLSLVALNRTSGLFKISELHFLTKYYSGGRLVGRAYGKGPQAGLPSWEKSASSLRSPVSSCTESQLGEGPAHSYLLTRGLSRGCVCSSDAPASQPIHPDLRHTRRGPGHQHLALGLQQQLPGGLPAPTLPLPPPRVFLHLAIGRLSQSQRQAISSSLKTLPQLPLSPRKGKVPPRSGPVAHAHLPGAPPRLQGPPALCTWCSLHPECSAAARVVLLWLFAQ